MTRETKLGIGVAGTFLAVVGTWAGVKLHRGEPDSPAEPPAVAQANQTAAAPEENKDSGAAAKQTSMISTPAPTTDPAPMVIKSEAVPVLEPPNPANTSAPNLSGKTEEPPPPSMPLMTPPANSGAPSATETPAPALPVPGTIPTTSPPANSGSTSGTAETPATPAPSQPAPIAGDIPTTPIPPVAENKKEGENAAPPNTIIITKPADAQPTPPIQQPTVTVVPTGVATAASLGPPGGGTNSMATAVRPKSEPRVQSYLEEEHRWQPGDRFEAVSEKYYSSEKYAAALQQYNREHPLAGLGMRQNPPAMVPGQAIWVPPVRILERDYSNLIADLQPLNDRGMPVSAVRPADSPPSGGTKLTKVRERGETMYEIARRTLNDSGQWIVVHRLNPTLSRDPKLPIPAGTVLRLPAEAKTEASDVP